MHSEKNFSWEQLSEKEKALMILYKLKLQNDAPFESIKNLIIEANNIHLKYPDFSAWDIP